MHDTKRMCGHKPCEKFDGIPPNVATLVFQTSSCKLSGFLTSFREFLIQVTESHVNLNSAATTIGVDVQETLLKNIKERIDLRLGATIPLFLFAEFGNQVATNFDNSAT